MNIDIAYLLRETLIENGCESHKLGDFDSHSTIALEFDGHLGIYITQLEDEVWLWTRLVEENNLTFSTFAGPLLEKLMEGCGFAANGQLQLLANEGYIELRGLVHHRHLESSAQFAGALDEFFRLSEEFHGIYQ